ncbi:glucosamine-6-phosphate deaminase [Cohnella thermotolerans]|uniref:glucosamine-6-phosphate deaminase n=1 Tax=Cohnella thermotolerans TaxID=329858 RepID=UPI00041ECA8D|nr:glucosamine-6-phosphate deaminase [Cohnella thermotolerans]
MELEPILKRRQDRLNVEVYGNRRAMGEAAAKRIAASMRKLLAEQDNVRMVFAAAPSQNEMLEALVSEPDLDWRRVTGFHMDEYIGLDEHAPERFSAFLSNKLFSRVPFREVHLLRSNAADEAEEAARYAGLLRQEPIDIVCLGVGENGHIAFNDPPVADFQDPLLVKKVELDRDCRQQQVNDGCFPDLASVPTHALTLTVPALTSGKHLFCIVPGERKREAVRRMLSGTVTTECPASILTVHPSCTLFTDLDAYGGGVR